MDHALVFEPFSIIFLHITLTGQYKRFKNVPKSVYSSLFEGFNFTS